MVSAEIEAGHRNRYHVAVRPYGMSWEAAAAVTGPMVAVVRAGVAATAAAAASRAANPRDLPESPKPLERRGMR